MKWINFFNLSLRARGTEDFVLAEDLRNTIKNHNGSEAYHSAFDLCEEHLKGEEDTGEKKSNGSPIYKYHPQPSNFPKSVSEYEGPARPALGYAWFDFDDAATGGELALKEAREFAAFLGNPLGLTFYYSGSKGFHIGVPFAYFGLPITPGVPKALHSLATKWKKKFTTLDTTVYNPQRKFRALGSKHPKTGLYKISLKDLNSSLDEIKSSAIVRGTLEIPSADPMLAPLELIKSEMAANQATQNSKDSISLDEWRRYRQPEGTRAFAECGFLSWARDNPAKIDEPQWYACASIVGRMKDGRAKFQAMSKGHPKYNVHDTDAKLEQALQASGPRTCAAIDKMWDGCKACPHYQKIKSPVVILEKEVIPTEATGFYDLIPNEKTGEIKRVPNYEDILKAFVREQPYKTIVDMKTVYAYNGTHYEECAHLSIKNFAEENFNPKPKEQIRQEFVHKVLANHPEKRTFFKRGTDGRINFKNGIFETSTKELIPHSPDYGFRAVLPFEYDPEASCSAFEAWLDDVMLGDKELVAILQEFMGYVVVGGEYKYHKALWLAGTGRNGKSTFLEVLKALVGEDNYSALSIKQIIADRFTSSDLDGKFVNFSEETSPEELADSGPFKNLTGNGDVQAQKKFGDVYKFRNRAKMVMTYNEVPQLKDLSPGMLSRPIIIPWKKDLTESGAQDKNLSKRLLSELPGIFNFAFKGWIRLEAQQEFTQSAKSELAKEDVQEASCTAIRWFKENITLEKDLTTEALKPRQLYEAYKQTIGQYAYSETKFFSRLSTLKSVATRKRRTANGFEYAAMKFKKATSNFEY